MDIVKLLSSEERKNKYCYFCGETRSVKYVVEINDPALNEDAPSRVCCCNVCLAIQSKINE